MAAVEQNFEQNLELQTFEEQNLEFYYDCFDRKRIEELKPSPMSAVGQNFEEILKE